MHKSYRKQLGFTVVEFLVVLVVVGALAFVGFAVMNKQNADKDAKQTSTSQKVSSDAALQEAASLPQDNEDQAATAAEVSASAAADGGYSEATN